MLAPLHDRILETYAAEPKYGRTYAFDPPVDLSSLQLFRGGVPYEAFREMRENAPVCWSRETLTEGGFWALTSYKDVRAVSLAPETFSSEYGGILMAYGTPDKRHP
ncbi:MAG TPA: hypothetical protein VK779_12680, partial [Rhizomicrobium sp.]|nr:hypothetical protein [Rhizomicrobium sp.]